MLFDKCLPVNHVRRTEFNIFNKTITIYEVDQALNQFTSKSKHDF